MEHVVLDDPNEPTGFNPRPERTTTTCKKTVYDPKGQKVVESAEKVVEIAENGAPTFYVYDAENQQCFKVDAKRSVIEYRYTIFGDIAQEIHYEKTIAFDAQSYLDTGLPLSLVRSLVRESSADRRITFTHNKLGKILTQKREGAFYCLASGENSHHKGMAAMCSEWVLNAFDEVVWERELIDPTVNQEQWSEKVTWLDRNGQRIAFSDPNYHITLQTRNAFGDVTDKEECAAPLVERPTPTMSLAELRDKLHQLADASRDV